MLGIILLQFVAVGCFAVMAGALFAYVDWTAIRIAIEVEITILVIEAGNRWRRFRRRFGGVFYPVCLVLAGCSSAEARAAVDASTVVYDAATPGIVMAYEAELRSCLKALDPTDCLAETRERWLAAKISAQASYAALALTRAIEGLPVPPPEAPAFREADARVEAEWARRGAK